jgi:phosphodiesterase/alkaline phosphatase D-like protein
VSASALVLASEGVLSRRAAANTSLPGYPFTLGVASGDPEADGVVLWTRLAPDPVDDPLTGGMPPDTVPVQWEVGLDQGFRRVVRSGESYAAPELGHSVHVEVNGLAPGREYFYRFQAGGEISPVGRTKTAPAPGARVDRLRFAVASCQAWIGGRYAAFQNMADEDLDVVFHLGDYIYELAGTHSLADFRGLHALYKTSPDLQAAHTMFPFVATFDDHEVDNNWAADVPQDDNPDFLELRANAFQAYYEHMPLRVSAMPGVQNMHLYRRLKFGRLAEFSVLDTRQYRSDQAEGAFIAPRDPGSFGEDMTMLGEEQEQWLFRGLERSQARWNVLAQQTMMAPYDYDVGEGESINHDQWDGYVVARDRFLDFVQRTRPSNPVVLSGDWHSSFVNDLNADWTDPESETVATEFVGTSISSGCGWASTVEAARSANPHVKLFNGTYRGYLHCEVTPDEWQTDLRIVTEPANPQSPVYTLAAFGVLNGQPGAVRRDDGSDGIGGQVSDAETGEPAPNVRVQILSGEQVAGEATSDVDGQYRIFAQPGEYDLVAGGASYLTSTQPVEFAGGGMTVDVVLERIVVAAGTGRVIPGPVSEGSVSDIVLENGMLAMTVAVTADDPQLRPVSAGKPIDMAARGGLDQLDWIILPYAATSQPSGGAAWAQRNVRSDDVSVTEVTAQRAVVAATGRSTLIPEVEVVTTYTVEPGQPWVAARSVFTNTGADGVDLWVGDVLDVDGSGERSGVGGHGTITTPDAREYPPSEPWIGMTRLDWQTYGLIYDDAADGLTAYGTPNWIMSQQPLHVPAGESVELRRRVVVVDNRGNGDPFAVLSDLYQGGES